MGLQSTTTRRSQQGTMQFRNLSLICLAAILSLGHCANQTTNEKASSPLINCGCQCSSLTFRDAGGVVQGNCLTVDSSGATWTPPTPPVRTWSPPRGSPTIPGHTRPVPLPLTPLRSVSGFPPQSSLSPLWLLPSLLSQWSQSIPRSIPPTLSPSLTLSPPPLWRVLEVRHKPSRRYSEPMEDMTRRLSENPDTAMLQARLTFQD